MSDVTDEANTLRAGARHIVLSVILAAEGFRQPAA
jgi:hypothetical protein